MLIERAIHKMRSTVELVRSTNGGTVARGQRILQAFIEERATAEQRTALLTIRNDRRQCWFEFLASTSHRIRPAVVPIEFEFDKKKRRPGS